MQNPYVDFKEESTRAALSRNTYNSPKRSIQAVNPYLQIKQQPDKPSRASRERNKAIEDRNLKLNFEEIDKLPHQAMPQVVPVNLGTETGDSEREESFSVKSVSQQPDY